MTDPTPYLLLPGTAREALTFYGALFGCDVELHTFEALGRTDGPSDAIGHGWLSAGPVSLFASDVAGEEPSLRAQGIMLALLGTAAAATLRAWFAGLADGGTVVDDLRPKPWGDTDGQVIDRFGVHWLIGFHGEG